MTGKNITGVILAAGKGTRMEPFSKHYPKSLLPVCNKPIMEHHINIMKSVGITEIIIVIGHLGFEIAKTIGDGELFGVKIKYIEQSSNLGIAHAVGTLEPYIQDPFLLFLGDIFFIPKNFKNILDPEILNDSSAVLAVKLDESPESIKRNFAIQLDTNNKVKRVIEKPRYVNNRIKGCGIYLFDLHIFDAIRRTHRTAMRDEYELTDSIQILIEDGFCVDIAEVISEDINITFPHDLLLCNLEQLKFMNKEILIDKNTSLHEAKVINSIIGKNCNIQGAEVISNSLIFNNVTTTIKGNIDYSIITQNGVIDCRGKL